METAYIIDCRDMTNVRTIKVAKSVTQVESFNIYSAILPKFAPGDNTNKRQTELNKDSLEYRLIAKNFLDSLGA